MIRNGGSLMNKMDFQSRLKNTLDDLGKTTIYELLKNDILYQNKINQLEQAEQKFCNLLPTLTKEQQTIIEQYITYKDSSHAEFSTVSYIAGMKDMFQIFLYLK